MEEKQTIFEDLKKIKGYILGVIAFATAVSVFFTQVLNLPIQPVLATMFIATICMLFIGFLIEKSEERQRTALKEQEEKSIARVESFKESVNFHLFFLEDLETFLFDVFHTFAVL